MFLQAKGETMSDVIATFKVLKKDGWGKEDINDLLLDIAHEEMMELISWGTI